MYQEKNLTEQESLQIIQQMIQTAKQEQKDDGLGWIIWGWLLFTASMLTWLNLRFGWFSNYLFWNIFGGLTAVFILYELLRYRFFQRKERVKTYTGDLFKKLNAGFFLFLIMIILSMNLGVHPVKGFALLIGLYGFWILIYGTALDFRPSIIGAYVCWGFGFAALFLDTDQFGLLMILHALAVLFGYLVPGHIAYKEFKKINRTVSV